MMRVPPNTAMRGFSVVELMVAIAIFGILVALSVPMYGSYLANTQVRNAAESMLTGVHLAQTEAVKRNGVVEFLLDPANGWTVNLVEGNVASQIQTVPFKSGSKQATVTPTGAMRRVSFNGLGRICCGTPPRNPIDNSAPLGQVDVTSPLLPSARSLRLVIGSAYGIKLCDPALAATDPAGCP